MNRRERKQTAQYLDELIPLQGASHTEVVDYLVSIPMRYAELRARLANGKTARLANTQQFLGWLGYGANPTLLFDCGERRVVVATGRQPAVNPNMFIARDGGQVAAS
ncbi:MAG: hypothetical protein ACR2QT_08650 [Woeseiaceae bacterium]